MADFGFSNIIYLILIVVFAIFSSQKKKRKKEITHSSNASNQQSNVKSFFEELLMGEQANIIPEPQVDFYEEPEIEMPEEPILDKKEDIIVEDVIEKVIKHDYYSQNTFTEVEIDFDLRKAVINSEILNRKYF